MRRHEFDGLIQVMMFSDHQLLVTEVAADQALPDHGHPQLAVLTIDIYVVQVPADLTDGDTILVQLTTTLTTHS